MDNKTIRWVSDSVAGLGAGAAITGFSTLYLLAGDETLVSVPALVDIRRLPDNGLMSVELHKCPPLSGLFFPGPFGCIGVSMVRLLAVSGSLRAASSNSSLLRAAERLSPQGMVIQHYLDVGQLPHFDPDLADKPPEIVLALRELIGRADGVLISCPEYARGIPGAFKNALDWLVASHEFPGKPVALFNASPRASHAQAALRLVLETMSATIVEPASITVNLLAKDMDEAGIAADPQIRQQIVSALEAFKGWIDGEAQVP